MRRELRGGTCPAGSVRQRTLREAIEWTGIALHSGEHVRMTLKPGEADSGIVFRRTDGADRGSEIPATWDRVVGTVMCTTLGNEEGVRVGTVEHLMAAFYGAGVDNALVELGGPEVPIMDGSAEPFISMLERAGLVEQPSPRRVIRVLKPVAVEDGERLVSLAPSNGFTVHCEIRFENPAVARQAITLGMVNGTFSKELSRARTFGFLNEVERMQAAGFAKGGSLDNAIVVHGDRILNEGGLRFEDEFVRHKALDAVGDLYLAGAPLVGRFESHFGGHALNNRLLHALFADDRAWTYDVLAESDVDAVVDGGIDAILPALAASA